MIKPLSDLYLVSLDEEQNSKTKSGLFIDTTWSQMHHAVQNGIIESVPKRISDKYNDDINIEVGQKVYFHHFVHANDNYILDGNKKLFNCARYHLYCVMQDDKIVMIDEWLLSSPILETEDSIIKTFGTLKLWTKASPDKVFLHATAEHVSKECEKQGVMSGDTIIFRKDADYEMTIEGKKYYRMSLKNVVAVIRDGKLLPLRDEIIVIDNRKDEEVRPSGIIIAITPSKEQIESVMYIGSQDEEKQFSIGDEVMFIRGTGQKVEHDGVKYLILRQEEIAGAMKEVL